MIVLKLYKGPERQSRVKCRVSERGLLEAHLLRVARGDHHIADVHVADAIEALTQRGTRSLSRL